MFSMLVSGGTLSYLSIAKELFNSDSIFLVKLFIALFMLMTVGVLFFFSYKFRILLADRDTILSIHPFRFKKEKIDRTKIRSLQLKNFSAFRGTVYRKVKVNGSDGLIEISDLEFENFECLISDLEIDQNEKWKIDLKQATSNQSSMNFNTYLLSGFLIFLVLNAIWNSGLHPVIVVVFFFNVVLLYASIKRRIRYEKILTR